MPSIQITMGKTRMIILRKGNPPAACVVSPIMCETFLLERLCAVQLSRPSGFTE